MTTLTVTTIAAFFEHEAWRHVKFPAMQAQVEERRASIPFPHRAVTEGIYPSNDLAIRWCWGQFGPYRGECIEAHSEYPACPEVLASGHFYHNPSWDSDTMRGEVPPHSHGGCWAACWLGKTNYDFGYMEWCFSSQGHLDAFLAMVAHERRDDEAIPGPKVESAGQ